MDTMDEVPPSNQPEAQNLKPDTIISRELIYHWVKKVFACNPFYAVSAALLLYGLYLVSSDADFLTRESSQLLFNFSALQIYEILLVITAVALARRRIWYDSMLLIGVENLLVLVPFILISQAALLNQRLVWLICVAGGAAAFVRFGGLKRYFKELNLPRCVLLCGFVLLAINVALPLIFRHLHESKVGTKPTEGAAYELNRYSWLLLLPAMVALVNLLPRPRQAGDLLPQRRWLPLGLFLLWLIGSAVHLYSLSYVYNFDWERAFYFPVIWVALWSVYLRLGDFFTVPRIAQALLTTPLLVTLLAHDYHEMFVWLSVANIFGFGLVILKDKTNFTARHLLMLSFTALAAALVAMFPQGLPMPVSQEKALYVGAFAYLCYWLFRSTNPKAGLLGALVTIIGLRAFFDNPEIVNVAAQSAMLFVLLHSLRWDDASHKGAMALRLIVAGVWVGHVWLLVHTGWTYSALVAYGGGVLLLVAWGMLMTFSENWPALAVPIAGALAGIARPGDFVLVRLHDAPAPLLAMMGSFFLFGLGTLAALTKSKWNAPRVVAVPANSLRQTEGPKP